MQNGSTNLGAQISLLGADTGGDWGFITEERETTEILPLATLTGATSPSEIDIQLPNDLVMPGTGTTWTLRVQVGDPGVDAVAPVANVQASAQYIVNASGHGFNIEIHSDQVTGEDGNNWDLVLGQLTTGSNTFSVSGTVITFSPVVGGTLNSIVTAANAAVDASSDRLFTVSLISGTTARPHWQLTLLLSDVVLSLLLPVRLTRLTSLAVWTR